MSALRGFCLLPLLCFTACTGTQFGYSPSNPVAGQSLSGKIRGGQQPVSGATIQLYATGTTGDGSAATPLLSPAAVTDANGNFSITSTYICPSATSLVYIVGTGGNPGLTPGTNNSGIALMAALGQCGNLSSSTFTNIDEVTTIAAITPLAPFASSISSIGASTSDSASLAAAFTLAGEFANSSAGTSPGPQVPTGLVIPSSTINTLANILAACVNSSGGVAGDGSNCGNLFTYTTPVGFSATTDTLTAALRVAKTPTLNTASLFNLSSALAPFQPSLASPPQDFTLVPTVSAGLQPTPGALSFTSTVGSPATAQTITLTNNSQTSISLTAFSINGFNLADFSQTNNCTSALAASASCTVQVGFTPLGTGVRVAELSVVNSSGNSPLVIGLFGTSVLPHLLSASPASLSAGSPSTTVTLTGTGFTPSSFVYLSGIQPATYISPQSISFTVASQYLNYTGALSLEVYNSGYLSNALSIPIVNPAPTLTSISPASVIAGSPNFTLTLNGTNFSSLSTVLVGGVSYPISIGSNTTATINVNSTSVTSVGPLNVTVSNPTPGGGTSAAQTLSVIGADNRVRTLSYPTNDIASDPVHNLIYASVSASSSTSPNSIIAINPLTGAVVTTQAMASTPGELEITSDASYLYVSLSSNTITRLLLPSLTPDISWSVPYTAQNMAPAPGQPHTIAVAGGTSAYGGVTVYDDGVARALTPQGSFSAGTSYNTLSWGADATSLYATSQYFSSGAVYRFTVNQSGPTLTASNYDALGASDTHLFYESSTGRLYDGYGNAINAQTGVSAGIFPVQGSYSTSQAPFVVDSVQSKAFFLESYFNSYGYSAMDIQAFDSSRFSFLNSIEVSGLSGSRLARWGTSGLAVGGGSQIFLIDGSFVAPSGTASPIGGYAQEAPTLSAISPQTATAGSPAVTLTLTGVNFSQVAVVNWGTQVLSSTWQSSTQMTATIPVYLLTQAGGGTVTVTNGPGTESSVQRPFTILPNLGPNTQITALDVSGEDMVWDPLRALLYVAVTNQVATNGNSIVSVDPAQSAIESVLYTGGMPGALGISSDFSTIYAGFQTQPIVQRYALPNFTPTLTIPLTQSFTASTGPYLVGANAYQVAVAPGQSQTFAASLGNPSYSVTSGGLLAVFDNATERANTYSGGGAFRVTWGADSTELLGNFSPGDSISEVTLLGVNSTGITGVISYDNGITDVGIRSHYDPGTNLYYSDGGRITNPDGTSGGFLELGVLMVPDSTLNRAFVLRETNQTTYTLDIFNLSQQTYLKSITIPSIVGYPTQMVRWGSQGIAILTDNVNNQGAGLLYILQGSDISGLTAPPAGSITLTPASVQMGVSTGATITVSGTGFLPTSVVVVNGSARTTTYVSATQVTFQLTAADQAFANYLSVAVTNAGAAGTTTPGTALAILNPVPVIANLSPSTALFNYGPGLITINGSSFLPGTVAEFNGSACTTTYISPTQITVALNSFDLGTAGSFPITAFNYGPGGGTSGAAALQINYPVPVISSLGTSTIAAGSASQSIYVFGSGFASATVAQIAGTPRTTSYISSSQLQVVLTASDLANPGTLLLTAANPTPGGGTSAAATITVTSGIPGAFTLSPSAAIKGTATPTTITVNGSNLLPGAVVYVNGSARATTYVNSMQMTFQLTVADQANATTLTVTVTNPQPGGGSVIGQLTVAAASATPVISALNPTQFTAGSGASSLYVTGTGLTSNSVIQWNGAPLATYLFTGSVYAPIPANLLASAGTATITVNTPTATPSLSNSLSISIVNPAVPTLSSISPANGPFATAFTATLTGTGFTTSSAVAINGVAIPTTFSSVTQLTAVVPASAVTPGNNSFTVTTPSPGGGTSAAVFYTAYVPIVNNSMIYNPVSQLFYLAIPSSAGAPYGNSVVSLDPVTGLLGTPIFVGSEPNRLALTSDGQYLWVGLSGASSIVQVNLATGTPGLQFPLPSVTYYPSAPTISAMIAVPGQENSVIVAFGGSELAYFQNGVLIGKAISSGGYGVTSFQINSALGELYAASGGNYETYSYSSSGVASKYATLVSGIVSGIDDRIQLAAGSMYTEHGPVLNPETGAQTGSFFSSISYSGSSTAVDAPLGLAFILDSSAQYAQAPNQIQVFNLSNLTQSNNSPIPLSASTSSGPYFDLTRWGANGLAFRNGVSVYPLRSNLVQNLSTTPADLSVALASSGPNTTGNQTTYVATIANAGPSSATEVSFNEFLPSTGVLVSASSSAGVCYSGANVTCNLGALVSGGSATVTVVVNQSSSGTATATAQVSASETDPNLANNQSSNTAAITGQTYTPAPTLQSVSPSTILAGAPDTVITLTGTNFGAGTTIQMDGAAVSTNVVSATQVSATIPAAALATLGWHALAVSNPAPYGGLTASLPLTIYSAIAANANHMLYDPFSRNIYFTVGSTVANGNSLRALTPATGVLAAPIPIGSEPSRLSLSDDGQALYVLVNGLNEIVRFNMLTQQPQFGFLMAQPFAANYATSGVDFSVQTGSENTLAITNYNNSPYLQIVDFNPSTQTAVARPNTTGYLAADTNPRFLSNSELIVDYMGELGSYTVSGSGVSAITSSYSPLDSGPFRLVNGVAYTSNGGVINVAAQPFQQLGYFSLAGSNTEAAVAPDPAIGRVYFLASLSGSSYTIYGPTGILAFDTNTYMPDEFLPMNIAAIDGTTSSTAVDLFRWGQDGVAALTSAGNIYLLRGPAVVPQLLGSNSPAALQSSSSTSIQHGSGNTVLTLTGTNFLPGVAILWNGSYRTTTFINSTQVTVDVPASDLLSAGTASITASNPGASISPSLTVTIN